MVNNYNSMLFRQRNDIIIDTFLFFSISNSLIIDDLVLVTHFHEFVEPGAGLGGSDTDGQLSLLELGASMISGALEEAERERIKKEKRENSMWNKFLKKAKEFGKDIVSEE